MAKREQVGQGGIRNGGGLSLDKPSGPSSSSGDSHTLRGESSPKDTHHGTDTTHIASPSIPHASPQADINAIMESDFFKTGTRYFEEREIIYAGNDSRPGAPRFMPAHSANRYKRNGTPFGGAGGYRTSRTWLSPENQRQQEFQVVRNAMRRLFKKSEVATMTYDDYIKHLEAVLASKKARLAKILATKEADRAAKEQNDRKGYIIDETLCAANVAASLPNNTNVTMKGNIGRVLGEKTIWCLDWQNGKDEIADWPSQAEMKWEGDDRAKTGVGRYPPLPRERGAIGLAWSHLQVVDQYPMDQIAQIPTMEDVYLPVDEIPEELTFDLINKELLNAMDTYLAS